jgi:hypothetical protein
MPYLVLVDDNFHYMDESARSTLGEFADAGAAIDRCRQIVDEYLQTAHRPGMSAKALFESYVTFGEDPFILCRDATEVRFSAWDYALSRCSQMCEST